MKNLQEKIIEGLIVESVAKNVHNPRKGSTLWVLKDGETKALPIKVEDNYKVKSAWYGKTSGGYDINIELAKNEYNIDGWTEAHYGKDWDYSDEKYQVKPMCLNDVNGKTATYYVGTSKEAIQEFIRTQGSKKLEGILKQIEKVQNELAELMQKKQRAEAEANLEINESLEI